jgi:hypothetical protein
MNLPNRVEHHVGFRVRDAKAPKDVPVELDMIADAVLNYRPKNKAKNLRPKKRKKAK